MMQRLKVLPATAWIALSAMMSCASVAQSAFPQVVAQAVAAERPVAPIGADVGAGWNILPIHWSAFTTVNGTHTNDASGYRTSSVLAVFQAPVVLPSGAGIGYLGLFAYDTSPSDVVAQMDRYVGFGVLPQCSLNCPFKAPGFEEITRVESIGQVGYQYVSSNLLNPLHTVNNDVVFNGQQGGHIFVTVHLQSQAVGVHGFRGVDIWWKRQISPAPSVASFVDVPTTHLFFREIEALKEAGITLGCTATTFCPDASLTRAQMAAFLARALGLYWQY